MWRSMTWWSTQLYQFGIDKKWADLQAWRINPDLAGVSGIISTSTVWRRTLVCPVDEIVLSVLSPRPPLQELWGKDRLVLNQEWFGMIARCCQMLPRSPIAGGPPSFGLAQSLNIFFSLGPVKHAEPVCYPQPFPTSSSLSGSSSSPSWSQPFTLYIRREREQGSGRLALKQVPLGNAPTHFA